jgi:hypothetical protein
MGQLGSAGSAGHGPFHIQRKMEVHEFAESCIETPGRDNAYQYSCKEERIAEKDQILSQIWAIEV